MQVDEYAMTCRFVCVTASKTEIDNLKALSGPVTITRLLSGYMSVQVLVSGQLQSLVINGTTYTYCAISKPIQVTELLAGVAWRYEVEFVMDTSLGGVPA
jgi:hypothetical protein